MINTKYKYITLTILATLAGGGQLLAQEAAGSNPYFYDEMFTNFLIGTAAVVILGALFALTRTLSMLIEVQQLRIYQEQGVEAYKEAVKAPKESWWKRQYKKWTDTVPVEKEQDVMLDHNYDGIRELDNNLPPWWVAIFYISIVFGVIYFAYYHVLGYGESSREEYAAEVEAAEQAAEEYRLQLADAVDETNVILVDDEQALALGKTIFDEKCAACHGYLGEGGVGPNLTDDYWIHGGDIKDVFRTIKYGVPEKGMIAWNTQMRPTDMQKVSSYIQTLHGTNPPNAKEPQGDLFQANAREAESTEADTEDEAESQMGLNEEN